ncbi:MAG: barstar family protein [Luteimonas sp.]
MSATDLSALLADPAPGGAYFIDARDRAALVEAATALDFHVAAIDCSTVHDRDAGLAKIADALAFPDWFGGTWDALADCLGDLSWLQLQGEGFLLFLDHSSAWREAEPEAFTTLLDILNDAGRVWADARKPFWALLPLPTDTLATLAD